MTRDKANELLDELRYGDSNISRATITEALRATGDLAPPAPFIDSGRPDGWHPGPRVDRAERREHESFVRLAATVCAPLTVGDLGISGG
jgi:hypothetical protein